jgi:hypothetical protein
MTREPVFYLSLAEARKSKNFEEFTVFEKPKPVRVKGKLAEDDKSRRFVQLARAMAKELPPRPVVFVGYDKKHVIAIPSRDATSMPCSSI